MPQLAPLFARMMLGKSRDTKLSPRWMPAAAAAGRAGDELEISPAGTQLAGDDRRRSYRYESARLGRVGGY
jgi:hypothetical protein